MVGIAATEFAVTQTPVVCTSVSKYGRPSASCGRPCTHDVVHVVGTRMCTPPGQWSTQSTRCSSPSSPAREAARIQPMCRVERLLPPLCAILVSPDSTA